MFELYGGDQPTHATLGQIPEPKGVDRRSLKSCIVKGWTGFVPSIPKKTMP